MHRRLAHAFLPDNSTLLHPWLPEGGGEGGGGGGGGGGSDTELAALQAYLVENKLAPGQLQARLEASKQWEGRAKANVPHEDHQKVVDELNQLKQKDLTAEQKALEDARAEGRKTGQAEAAVEFGSRLVAAEFRGILAGGRVVKEDGTSDSDRIQALVSGLHTAAYLKDDGSVDTEALTKWADAVAPAPAGATGSQGGAGGSSRWPSFGQGTRPAPAQTGASLGDAEADRRFGKQQ